MEEQWRQQQRRPLRERINLSRPQPPYFMTDPEVVAQLVQQQQMVQVQVPQNAYPGMHVQARIPDGRTIDVPIPAGGVA